VSAPIRFIDSTCEAIGRAVSWLTLALVLVTCVVVALRYLFGVGAIWLQESTTWMHAAIFMLAAAWALRTGDHVRVDVFHKKQPPRVQAWIDLAGTVLFLMPFAGFLLWSSLDYVTESLAVRERSREAGGLPALYLLKSLIPIAASLLILQGIAEAARAVARLRAS
jgi:TRAP-type mannitol/chloroaromatic compound transport system permease small subunit